MLLQALKCHLIQRHFITVVMTCRRNLILAHINLTMVKPVLFLWCCFKSQNLRTMLSENLLCKYIFFSLIALHPVHLWLMR